MGTQTKPLDEKDIFYPDSDDEPMAATGTHVEAVMLLHQALQDFFADQPDVLVMSDQFLFWVKGDPDSRLAPDAVVVPGVGKELRKSFKIWEENAIPTAIFETTSKGTVENDEGEKLQTFQKIGVREYFLFDPEALYLHPPLKGYRLSKKVYRRIPIKNGWMESELGFNIAIEGIMLRLHDRRTGTPVLTRAERVQQVQKQNEEQGQRIAALEAELARFKAMNHPNGNGS